MVLWDHFFVVLLQLSCSEVSKMPGTQDRNSKRQMRASPSIPGEFPVQFRWVAKELQILKFHAF